MPGLLPMNEETSKYLVTIVTVVLNGVDTIESAIKSVVNNHDSGIEYIIIDGGSTDGTMQIIKKYENEVALVLSEPDDGIYDAMNKGIEKATGEWIFFLGCDDELISIPDLSKLESKYQIVYGDVVLGNGKNFYSRFQKSMLYMNTLHHQAAFYKAELLKSHKFNTEYRVMADYLVNLVLYKEGVPAIYIPQEISRFGLKGVSSSWIGKKEWLAIVYKYNGIVMGLVATMIVMLDISKALLRGGKLK